MPFDAELWAVVIANALTPLLVFTFPWRVTATLTAGANHHWLLVTIVADIAGTLGMIPYYLWCRHAIAPDWTNRLRTKPLVHRLVQRLQERTGWLLLTLNIIPVPDPTVSLVAGSVHYPFWCFLAICQVGKLLHILPLTLGALLFHRQIIVLRAWIYQHQYIIWLAVFAGLGWWIISTYRASSK